MRGLINYLKNNDASSLPPEYANLKEAYYRGKFAAMATFKQPSLASVGIKAPTNLPGMPPAKPVSMPAKPTAAPSLLNANKLAKLKQESFTFELKFDAPKIKQLANKMNELAERDGPKTPEFLSPEARAKRLKHFTKIMDNIGNQRHTVYKFGTDVGMAMSNSSDGTGAARGTPADEGRRQQSVIDQAFKWNDDGFATSSMPMPGAKVSP
jgi:hypothetical protein